MDEADLRRLRHVVWDVTFWDEDAVLFRPDPEEDLSQKSEAQGEFWVAEATEVAIKDAAASVGLSLDSCGDDDSVGGVRYYEWRFLVPQVEHRRTGDDGVPLALVEMKATLSSLLPQAQRRWEFGVDEHLTWWHFLEDAVREDYAELLTPLEAAFRARLPVDEEVAWSESLQVQSWGSMGPTVFCTTRLGIGQVPHFLFTGSYGPLPTGHGERAWLEIGIRPSDEMLLDEQWSNVSRFGFDSSRLFTPVPRPSDHLLVVRAHGYESADSRTHEWFGYDGAELAERVLDDHRDIWFPVWQGYNPRRYPNNW